VSVKRYRVFAREAHGARSRMRPPQIAATDQDSPRRGRSKCGGDALTKESVAAQDENRVHQTGASERQQSVTMIAPARD
jgi:hypothetical protein